MSGRYHIPVMRDVATSYLVTASSGTYVDATAGGGGHTGAILEALASRGRVIAIDRDPDAIEQIHSCFAEEIAAGSLIPKEGRFSELPELIGDFAPVCGLLLDLGVSSHQIDKAQRGFSYRHDSSLDMRMDQQSDTSAAQVVNEYSETELRRLLHGLGDEPQAGRIARDIVKARPVATTAELANVISRSVPARHAIKTLSRCFQAIRIEVNQEMDELTSVLAAAPDVVQESGRCVVISYHSGEDRKVKRMFSQGTLSRTANVHPITGQSMSPWKVLTSSPVRPDDTEIEANGRARSARLRAAERRPLSSVT